MVEVHVAVVALDVGDHRRRGRLVPALGGDTDVHVHGLGLGLGLPGRGLVCFLPRLRGGGLRLPAQDGAAADAGEQDRGRDARGYEQLLFRELAAEEGDLGLIIAVVLIAADLAAADVAIGPGVRPGDGIETVVGLLSLIGHLGNPVLLGLGYLDAVGEGIRCTPPARTSVTGSPGAPSMMSAISSPLVQRPRPPQHTLKPSH